MQYAQHVDAVFAASAEHHEVTAMPPMSRHMQNTDARSQIIARAGTGEIGAFIAQRLQRKRQRVHIRSRLSRTESPMHPGADRHDVLLRTAGDANRPAHRSKPIRQAS